MSSSLKNLLPVFEPFCNNRVTLIGSPKLDLMMIGVLLKMDLDYGFWTGDFCTLNGCFAASKITGISIDGKEFSQKSKEILFAALIDIRSKPRGFWQGPAARYESAMHYSTWLTSLGMVGGDSKHRGDWRTEGQMF